GTSGLIVSARVSTARVPGESRPRSRRVMKANLLPLVVAIFAVTASAQDPPEKPEQAIERAVLPLTGPLFKAILKQKVLAESEDSKLWPHQEAAFLARQSAFRYAAGEKVVGTGLAGVTFAVRPEVSPD